MKTSPTSEPSNLLSYSALLLDRKRWLQGGGTKSSPEALYDTPAHSYFRILFHFLDETEDGTVADRLLGPAWFNNPTIHEWSNRTPADPSPADYPAWWSSETAYSYLVMNQEYTRANYLKEFITLLSAINTSTPWYFQAIKGLDEAINRAEVSKSDFMYEPERQKISIECLDDSQDHKIGTLLDLYRSVVWSHRKKCWVLPANLRKFDMSIVVMSSPVKGVNIPWKKPQLADALGKAGKALFPEDTDGYATADINATANTSFTRYEFHNCEIEYSSAGTWGASDVTMATGFSHKYTISISYDDMVETRYNEFGDLLIDETGIPEDEYAVSISPSGESFRASLGDQYIGAHPTHAVQEDRSDIHSGIGDQIVGGVASWAATKVNNLVLGNLFGFSLDKTATQIGQVMDGNLGATVSNIKGYIKKDYKGYTITGGSGGNINEPKEPPKKGPSVLGNIYKASSIISQA